MASRLTHRLITGLALLPLLVLAATGGPSLSFRCRMMATIEHDRCCPATPIDEDPGPAFEARECCEALHGDTFPEPGERATRLPGAAPDSLHAVIRIIPAGGLPQDGSLTPSAADHPPPRPPPLELKRALLI